MRAALFAELRQALAARRGVVLVTALPGGEQTLIDLAAPTGDIALKDAIDRAVAGDTPLTVERGGGESWFVQPYLPPLRLLIVGAVHIAQPLAAMAEQVGLAVTLIDPRTAFATAERFPGLPLHTGWPDAALRELAPDRRSAVVTLTHDPKLDDPALDVALRSPAFYVGALGSRKTHAARLGRLARLGHDEVALGRIHGPVGLRIGARTPAEIAVSILAEIVAQLRQGAS